ncbi:hypothetical protein [Streptomyces sp. enrichment culture]|uniref:hypothetical protein n=1 Tax=Streptomyces sp. enrichment culture TaxID=1795815 RepID=UPI003F556490
MLRVNPLPRVRPADSVPAALLRDMCAAEDEVEAPAEVHSAHLHRLIGATADPGERGRLIALRRDIHNDRVPRTGDDCSRRERAGSTSARPATTTPTTSDG